MTDLYRRVRRRTVDVCPTTRRRWVVELLPGDTFSCREEGRRRRYLAPLRRVCLQVVKWNIEAEKAAKKKKRKTRKVKRGFTWR